MKSFIAALRSLVLPFGATTGARIVLDGVNGRIQVYNTSGVLVGILDGITGFQFTGTEQTFHVLADGNVYVRGIPETGGYVQLASGAGRGGLMFLQPEDSTVPGVVFYPADFYVDANESGAVNSQPVLYIDSPYVTGSPDKARASIEMYGQTNTSATDDSAISIFASVIALFADDINFNVGPLNPSYQRGEYGSFGLSFGPAASATVIVTYAKTYTTPPLPYINIDSGSGTTARWVARAIARSTTGFTVFVFAADGAASTWVNVSVSWDTTEQH